VKPLARIATLLRELAEAVDDLDRQEQEPARRRRAPKAFLHSETDVRAVRETLRRKGFKVAS